MNLSQPKSIHVKQEPTDSAEVADTNIPNTAASSDGPLHDKRYDADACEPTTKTNMHAGEWQLCGESC